MKQYLLLLEISTGSHSSVIGAQVITAENEDDACARINQENNSILDCQLVIDGEAETVINYTTE